jgi:hypothetical protein
LVSSLSIFFVRFFRGSNVDASSGTSYVSSQYSGNSGNFVAHFFLVLFCHFYSHMCETVSNISVGFEFMQSRFLVKLCRDGISTIITAVFLNAFTLDRSFFIFTSGRAEQENYPYGISPFLLM